MKAEGFNWYGESNEDEDEDERLAAEEEKASLDLASLLKGETADEKDSSPKSIGEIFGITKPEDTENSEPSTFDKIIDHTLEEDLGETKSVETETVADNVESEMPEQPNIEEMSTDSQLEESDEPEDELTPTKAVASKTVYEGGHEYPLADLSSDTLPPFNSDDSTENQPDTGDQELGRTEKISEQAEASSFEPEPVETEPAAAPNFKENQADTVPEPEVTPSEEPEQPPPETAERDSAENASTPEPEPSPKAETSESAEEAERRASKVMEDDEGPEDPEPPRHRNAAAGEESSGPEAAKNIKETLAETENNQSQVGVLALLLGVREIFKRRKGDKENNQERIKGDKQNEEALEEHERLERLKRRELEAAQNQVQRELDQLAHADNTSENTEITDIENETHAYGNQFQENIFVDQANTETFVKDEQAAKIETPRSRPDEQFNPEFEYYTKDLDEQTSQKLEINEIVEQGAEQLRKWNQEVDGELALDNRHETSSVNKIPVTSVQGLEQPRDQPVHISDVIAGSGHGRLSSSDTTYTDSTKNLNSHEALSRNDEFRSSIKAGVTIGLIIAVLAGIFLIFS